MGFLSGLFGGGGPSTPRPPDPNKVTQNQIATGQQVQGLNAPNQTGVFGNTQYSYGPGGNVTGVQTGLNPQYQQVQNSLLSGLGTNPSGVSDSIYNQYTSRLDPRFNQEQTGLETQLTNQGIPQGSEAWNRAMDNFGRQKNDAYTSAMTAAQVGGTQERSSLLQGLMGLGNMANAGYANIPQIATPNTAGYQYQNFGAAQDAYNAQMGAHNANTQGLFGLGSGIISALPWNSWLG